MKYTEEQIKSLVDTRLKETNRKLSEEQYNDLISYISNMSEEQLALIGLVAVHDEVTKNPIDNRKLADEIK